MAHIQRLSASSAAAVAGLRMLRQHQTERVGNRRQRGRDNQTRRKARPKHGCRGQRHGGRSLPGRNDSDVGLTVLGFVCEGARDERRRIGRPKTSPNDGEEMGAKNRERENEGRENGGRLCQ